MDQADMPWDQFIGIMDSIEGKAQTISLQGEGEPTLHNEFDAMVKEIANRGHIPYTITNGTTLSSKSTLFKTYFPLVGVSIDTLDPLVANGIGRFNVGKVVDLLETYLKEVGSSRIRIMTVDFGQDMQMLMSWVSRHQIQNHIIQPLQAKDDYASKYMHVVRLPLSPSKKRSTCSFVTNNVMKFYSIDGKTLPCCFMKDSSSFTTTQQLAENLSLGSIPKGCQNCVHLVPL